MRVLRRAHVVVTCKSCNAELEVERSDVRPGTQVGGRLTSSWSSDEGGSVWEKVRVADLGVGDVIRWHSHGARCTVTKVEHRGGRIVVDSSESDGDRSDSCLDLPGDPVAVERLREDMSRDDKARF
jgi:hypothetical protein